jgi:sulfatase modifying factor 1
MKQDETLLAQMIPQFPPVWAEVFGEDDYGIFAECSLDGVRFVWRWICPGTFMMGSPEDEVGRYEREVQHKVTLTRGYWLGETPVTQEQWVAVMGENPSHFKSDERKQLPVEEVNWHDCQNFAAKLNEHFPGLHAALPTEAQWEYACRAGTETAFNDGSVCTVPDGKDPALDRLGWFRDNSEGKTHVVKGKAANAWGLYDMHGNVWEWCADDWYDYDGEQNGVPDPRHNSTDDSAWRVLRGGSWVSHVRHCRCACRRRVDPGLWHDQGLRLAAGQELGGGAAGRGALSAGEVVAVPGGL